MVETPTIRHFGTALAPPPHAAGAAGRPLVNLTLAANYALGGLAVPGYRAANLLLHFLAALALGELVRRTLRRRGGARPAATWLLLAALMLTSRHRDNTVGFGLGVGPGAYLLTQARAIALYLRLCLWPHPLVIDYGTALVSGLGAMWPQGLLVLALLGAAAWALVRRPALGFLGGAFFAVLAPSSSFIPLVTQPIAEHRMYLPLAAAVVLAVLGLESLAGNRSLWLWPAAAGLLAFATSRRVADYRAEIPL